jgi:hypothetical protein
LTMDGDSISKLQTLKPKTGEPSKLSWRLLWRGGGVVQEV